MRVCFATTAFPRWEGDGQATFIWEAARAISRRGIEVRVVAMHSPDTQAHQVMNGMEIVRPPYWWPVKWEYLRRDGPAGLPIAWRKYPLARVQILPFILVHTLAVARCARESDLVHAQWTLSAGAASLGQWLHHRPILATVQGSDIFQVPRNPVGAWVTRKVLNQCNHITALSHALKSATAELNVPTDKISIVPNGVDTGIFTPPRDAEREKIILYVGSLIPRKGLKYLLDAAPEVFRVLPNYRIVMIGDGPQKADLERQVEQLSVGDRVTFIPFRPSDEIREWMQRAQVLVLPSLEEGMGVVLLEAMACGTPVIGCRVGGIQDVITPEVGALVPPADADSLSATLCDVLSNPSRWTNLSHAARDRAEKHYDWDVIAAQFTALYDSIL
jgi:glycosyltransferase involved in cell wall biosynthesis